MHPTLRTPLSPRERQIADMIGDNRSYQEIGDALALSSHTVRSYTVRMSMKIEFPGRPAPEPRAAVYALILYERFVAGRMAG